MSSQPGRARAADVLLVAAWSALAAGVGGLGVLIVRRFVLQQVVFAPRDVVWMLPLGHLAVFLVPALPLALLALLRPRLVPLRAAVAGFVLPAVFSVFLEVRAIHPYASLLLAAGIAARLAHLWGGERWPRVRPWLARSAALMLAAGAVFGIGWRLERLARSYAHHRGVPTPPAGAPNVLLIVLDTFRPDHLGVYGYRRPTSPHLDRLAAEGVTFERAIAASSWSLESHGSLFTGEWPSALSGRWTHPLDRSQPTLAEVMARAGWATAGVSGNHVYGAWESGIARGFEAYRAYVVTPAQVLLTVPLLQMPLAQQLWASRSLREAARAVRRFQLRPPFEPHRARRHAPAVTDAFLSWQRRHADRPFFAFLNYFDAHELGVLPADSRTMFDGGRRPEDRYDGGIHYVDRWLGVLFDSLAARGQLDRTLVIVTADHGEQFGEHGIVGHGNSLYMQVLHVPLIVRLPGTVPAGQRIGGVVSLRDVAATVLDVAGVSGGPLPGTSLARWWRSDTARTSPAISEVERTSWTGTREPANAGPMRSVVWDDWHYIRNGDGSESLYRWTDDPAEARDLARDAAFAPALAEGRARLAATPGGFPAGPGR